MVSVGSLATKTLAFANIRPPRDSAYRGSKCIRLKDSSDRQDTHVQSTIVLAHLFIGSSQSGARCNRCNSVQPGNNCERKKPTR
jgi:hypothetical protein